MFRIEPLGAGFLNWFFKFKANVSGCFLMFRHTYAANCNMDFEGSNSENFKLVWVPIRLKMKGILNAPIWFMDMTNCQLICLCIQIEVKYCSMSHTSIKSIHDPSLRGSNKNLLLLLFQFIQFEAVELIGLTEIEDHNEGKNGNTVIQICFSGWSRFAFRCTTPLIKVN